MEEEEILIFDQLDMNARIDPLTGRPMRSIGEAIVAIESRVQNDF